jgi:hypothetical protein
MRRVISVGSIVSDISFGDRLRNRPRRILHKIKGIPEVVALRKYWHSKISS